MLKVLYGEVQKESNCLLEWLQNKLHFYRLGRRYTGGY